MLAVFILLALAGVLLLDFLYARSWPGALSLSVDFSKDHIYEGESCELKESVENRKKLPVNMLEIGFRLPPGLRLPGAENTALSDYLYKRDVFAIAGMERIVRRYRVEGIRRGHYRADQFAVSAPSLLLRSIRLDEELERMVNSRSPEVYVYARRVPVGRVLQRIEALSGSKLSQRRLYEDPFAFSSIREYAAGDPMRAVNWKATARMGSLMVNTFTSVMSSKTGIYLDVTSDGSFEDLKNRELMIAVAASLVRHLMGLNGCDFFRINAPRTGESDISQKVKGQNLSDKTADEADSVKQTAADGTNGSVTEFTSPHGSRDLTKIEHLLCSDLGMAEDVRRAMRSEKREALKKALLEDGREDPELVRVIVSADTSERMREIIKETAAPGVKSILVTVSDRAETAREMTQGNLSVLPYRIRV